jgi:pantetheine-phosphate adenylyltransferase
VTVVLYPGSFDPIHNGHVEIVETASRLFDRVVVAAMRNPSKGEPLFSLENRQDLIEASLAHLDNVEVTMFSTWPARSAPTSSSRASGRCRTSSPSCRWPR